MSRNALKLAATALMLLPLLAKAECKDLVMRMASPDGKREITTFFNCHGGSYQIPEATTTHFYEWKSNKLCETTRVCGNVSAWRGTFGVGAMWTFGSSVTDFAQKVNYLNQSNGTGQPNYVNYIQANNGNVCLNLASNQVLTYQQSGATSNALNCYPKAMMGQANWASALNALSGVGYQPVGGGNINDQSINFVCAQGDQNTLLSSANGVVNQANVQDCNCLLYTSDAADE